MISQKWITAIVISLYILTILSAIGYLNTMVSYQYEVKDARFMLELSSKEKTSNEIKVRREEIDQTEDVIRKNQVVALIVGSSSFLLAAALMLRRSKKSDTLK